MCGPDSIGPVIEWLVMVICAVVPCALAVSTLSPFLRPVTKPV